jgi:hypothetical protein
MEKAGDGRIDRETVRFFEHLEEEEQKRKKAKTEETTSRSNQAAASSSGGGGAEVQRSRGGVPVEITNKRKADEDQQEQPEKKNRSEQGEREAKRSIDEWEKYAEELKAGAERRAEENKRSKVWGDVEGDAMMEAIGAIRLNESDLKHNEVVEKFIDQLCEETFGEFYDAISGEALDSELIEKAREAEKETLKKHEVCEMVPLEDCWKVTGRAPVGVKWVDANRATWRSRSIAAG